MSVTLTLLALALLHRIKRSRRLMAHLNIFVRLPFGRVLKFEYNVIRSIEFGINFGWTPGFGLWFDVVFVGFAFGATVRKRQIRGLRFIQISKTTTEPLWLPG